MTNITIQKFGKKDVRGMMLDRDSEAFLRVGS
jgi:hypothetical protein